MDRYRARLGNLLGAAFFIGIMLVIGVASRSVPAQRMSDQVSLALLIGR